MKQWYEALFENYANKYENECFVHGTVGECDFIEKEIGYNKEARILDIGCGTGRHSIDLAKRGYTVTGIDLSESQLAKAREKALKQNLKIDFVQNDARTLSFRNKFDLVIMLCEGGFPLMETDEMNFSILRSATNALKSGGKFIFTTLNGLYPLFHSLAEFHNKAQREGDTVEVLKELTFDIMTFRDYNTIEVEDDLGNKKELKCNERYYVPSEITWLLKSLTMKNIDIFGAKLGAYSRSDALTIEDFEMLVIAEKE